MMNVRQNLLTFWSLAVAAFFGVAVFVFLGLTQFSLPRTALAANLLYISRPMAMVGSNSITLNWQTNLPASSEVFYSTTSPVSMSATSTTEVADNIPVINHYLTIRGLSKGTTYYMIIRSEDQFGNSRSTKQFSFTTAPYDLF